MCDYPGCNTEYRWTVGPEDGPKVRLCDIHKKLDRSYCGRCDRIVKVGTKPVATYQPYGAPSNIDLCEECDGLVKVACRKCTRIVKVSNTVIKANQPYGAPSNIALCETCDGLDKVQCRNCTRIVKVGDSNVTTFQPYGAPSNIALCETCDGLDKVECRKCDRIVKVGDSNVTTFQPYGAPSNIALCDACDELGKKKCGGCARITEVGDMITVTRETWYGGRVQVCRHCTIATYCRACGAAASVDGDNGQPKAMTGAFAVEQVNSQNVVGWRCAVCAQGALESKQGAQQYYDEAVAWMKSWVESCDEDYPGYGDRLAWDVARDATFQTEDDSLTMGLCETKPGDQQTYQITVLNFIPPIAFQQTLVHELTHAFTNENGTGDKVKIEGFCNYVSYLFLKHIESDAEDEDDRAEATRRLARMEDNNSLKYGVHFRQIRDALANQPAQAISWLSEQG